MWFKQLPIGRPKKFLVLVLGGLCFVLSGCFSPAVGQDLAGGYAIQAPDSTAQTAVVKRTPGTSSASVKVEAMVFEYGWDSSFVIAKQHPVDGDFGSVDTSVTNWFIVEVENDVIHGPLTEVAFDGLFSELGIAETVAFSNSIPIPE